MNLFESSSDFDRRKRRARRNWLRAEVEHLPGNQHVGIDFYCPRCGVVRFRPRRSHVDGGVWVERRDGDQLEELDEHGKIHVRCMSAGCERSDFQLTASKLDLALAEMTKRHAGQQHIVRIPLE